MAPNTILIVGATGRQDSFVLHELSIKPRSPSLHLTTSAPAQPEPKFLTLTRSATSPKAQALTTAYPALDLHVIAGYTQDPDPIFAVHPNIDAVFAYTVPPDEPRGPGGGGAAADARKEDELQILRPVALVENLNPMSFFGAALASLYATRPADTPLHLVSLRDVRLFAAEALLAPSSPSSLSCSSSWGNRFPSCVIGLGGDSLTLAEARAVYARVAGDGSQLPQA
ncbi:hypothetical protein DL769_008304 [Monosporascus sp. CRB-8-3]|nr:hypothetical protein DL769_008304 [Monosporascus sp. CRB-8-3]